MACCELHFDDTFLGTGISFDAYFSASLSLIAEFKGKKDLLLYVTQSNFTSLDLYFNIGVLCGTKVFRLKAFVSIFILYFKIGYLIFIFEVRL